MSRVRDRQAGFTLIEIMFVVVIIAILAAVAIPVFTESSRKGKANAEVTAWFAELQAKQERYKVDNGSYLDTSTACPTAPVVGGATVTCHTTTWAGLSIAPPTATAECSYVMEAGNTSGTTVSPFTFTSPGRAWYYIIATCDQDGSGGTNSRFFVSSIDSNIQKVDEGK